VVGTTDKSTRQTRSPRFKVEARPGFHIVLKRIPVCTTLTRKMRVELMPLVLSNIQRRENSTANTAVAKAPTHTPTEASIKGGVAIQRYTPATRPARPLTKQPP
jgi:hypothetical protein